MFEQELADKLKTIFGAKKVTYAAAGKSQEQECLFIEVEVANTDVRDGRVTGRVQGKAFMNAVAEKMPFGFFQKAIRLADPEIKKDLYFYEIENNTLLYDNIVQRGFSFSYFFNSQYDPATGSITSVDITVEGA